jgi:hypothetical protein
LPSLNRPEQFRASVFCSSIRLRPNPINTLFQALRTLGYIDGQTLSIEYRYAEGKPERLAALALELVQLKPNVIFAWGGDVAPWGQTSDSLDSNRGLGQ